MVTPLLHLPLNGSLQGRDRSGVLTASGSGAVRYRDRGDGSGRQAALVEEGTTNFALDPLVTNVANIYGGSANLTIEAGGFVDPTTGVAYNAVVANNSDRGFEWLSASIGGATTPRTFTASAWVNVPLGAPYWFSCRVFVTDINNVVTVRSNYKQYTGTGAWVYHTNTVTTVDGDTVTSARAYITPNVGASGNPPITFKGARGQAEERAYATSLCPEVDANGNLLPGYNWTGAANNSASTRSLAQLWIVMAAAIPHDRASVAIRVFPHYVSPATNRFPEFFSVPFADGFARTQAFQVDPVTPTQQYFYMVNADQSQVSVRNTSIPADQWSVVYLDWTPDVIGGQLNSGARLEATRAGYVAAETFQNKLLFGGSGAGTSWNSLIGDVLIFDRPLTDTERARLVALPSWGWNVLDDALGLVAITGIPDAPAVSISGIPDAPAVAIAGVGR